MAELIISIAILLLMLSLAGQVFNLTVLSTGQATALTRVNQDFRVLEQTLREDLRHVQPGQSVIVIQGNPVNAYWTHNGKEAAATADPSDPAGYAHPGDPEREDISGNLTKPRADMLMFFTARQGSSYVNAAVSSNVQQIVYGHAEIGEYTDGSDPSAKGCDAFTFNSSPAGMEAVPVTTAASVNYPDPKKVSLIPAERWHLARRAVLVLQNDKPTSTVPLGLDYALNTVAIDSPDLLIGQTDTLWNFNFQDEVIHLTNPDPSAGGLNGSPLFLPRVFTHGGVDHSLHARSTLGLTPPAPCADRLGHYFMPNCASFKVEWSLNPHSEFVAGRLSGVNETFWFDLGDIDPDPSLPAQPLRSLTKRIADLKPKTDSASKDEYAKLHSMLCDPVEHADGLVYSLADRFDASTATKVCKSPPGDAWPSLSPDPERPNLVVFTATRPVSRNAQVVIPPVYVPDDMFPGALRITVDMYDPERRLDKPLRHVMVIPIGE